MVIKVPATKPFFFKNDINFINSKFNKILNGKSFLSQSKYAQEFENKFSNFIGTKFGVSCNSGTSALELICRALNIYGKEVILPSNTFMATANAVINAGGKPIFADCDDDMCLSFHDIKKKINKNTCAVVIVHIGGIISKSIKDIVKFCKKKNIYLIEDAAQAHGSQLYGKKAGSFGIAAAFSFYSTKVMTTGEGGMVTTNSSVLAKKMRSSREFGKKKKGIYVNYHTSMGYNWRMQEVNALMGLRQLNSIKKFILARKKIAKIYDNELMKIKGVKIIHPHDKKNHNYFKYIIVLEKYNREIIHKKLQEKNIFPSGYVYEIPLHKQPVFIEKRNLKLPKTIFYCKAHLCLPIFYGMKISQTKHTLSTLKKILTTVKNH
jgi:dTDP-4-amino-4,6-dideoxygalactose transaminase